MADLIADAFEAFGASVRPSSGQLAAVMGLRDRVADAVAGDGSVLRLVDTGSFAHGTAVGASQLDVIVVLRGAKPKSLARSVEVVRSVVVVDDVALASARDDSVVLEDLVEAPAASAATAPAIAAVRLLPAYEATEPGAAADQGASDTLWVSDAAHRWVRHRPSARTVLLDRIDGDGAVRALIRLLLAWKHRQGLAVSSYYLETVALRQALQQRSFSLLWDLCWLWEGLSTDALAPVVDLTSPSQTQHVRACATLARALEAQFPVERAASSARGAVNAYIDGDLPTTTAYLRALFGDEFPAL